MTLDDEPDRDVTDELADELGLPPRELVDLYGGGWRRAPANRGGDTEEDHDDLVDPWAFSGQPYQLALRVRGAGSVELGRPVGEWAGPVGLRWKVTDRAVVHPLESLPGPDPIASALVQRRRSSFRYCRYCRTLTPPEHRFDGTTCYGCASRWFGIVY